MTHYDTLGVSSGASSDEIKKSYRKLAREHHPDKGGGKDAEETFKKISEAYSTISDPKKRAAYDEELAYGQARSRAQEQRSSSRGTGGEYADMFDGLNIDDLLAGMGGFSSGFAGRTRSSRGQDVHASLELDFDDTLESVVIPLHMAVEQTCATCHGVGHDGQYACPTCEGLGYVLKDKTVKARIPAGVRNGSVIKLAGKGTPGRGGGSAGDLILEIAVEAHPVFSIEKGIICLDVPVTFAEAALGGQIDVPLPRGGNAVVKVPAGSADGRVLRIKGKGVAGKDGKKGDVHARIRVQVPSRMNARAKEALREWSEAMDENDVREQLRKDAQH